MINLPPDVLVRRDPPAVADERSMLESWLEFHRATLLTKCEGLTEQALKARSAPPSSLSLIGLVRHLTQVEWNWFRACFIRTPGEAPYEEDAEFDVEEADVTRDFACFRAEVEASRGIAAGAKDLDVTGTGVRGGQRVPPSLRWVYVHMIEEYARHNGHADLLRERIDGVVGV